MKEEQGKQLNDSPPVPGFLTAVSDVPACLHEYGPSVARSSVVFFSQEKPEICVVNVEAPDF